MTTSIEGVDPWTGDILRLDCDDTIRAIHRSAPAPGSPPGLPLIAPALIDLQVNGFAGADVNGPGVTAEGIRHITDELVRRGILTWVPTIVTGPETAITASLRAVAEARQDPAIAAAIPYVHVEGPFLSDQDGPRGCHDARHIRPVDADEVLRWRQAGPVGLVTVSPHTDDAPAQIARIVASGVGVAIGHTHAAPAQIRAAVDAGAEFSTHLGNGIFSRLPRHPNQIWEQLADRRLTCGFIADGHHLPAATLTSMIRAVGLHRAFLISDAVALAGSPAGKYHQPVGGDVELSEAGRLSYAGTDLLAGAAADLSQGLRFAIASGIGVADALTLASATPASVIRRITGRRAGGLTLGRPANIIQLQRDGSILAVYEQGRLVA